MKKWSREGLGIQVLKFYSGWLGRLIDKVTVLVCWGAVRECHKLTGLSIGSLLSELGRLEVPGRGQEAVRPLKVLGEGVAQAWLLAPGSPWLWQQNCSLHVACSLCACLCSNNPFLEGGSTLLQFALIFPSICSHPVSK